MMEQVHLTPGSQEWLAYRKEHDNASDAPAMMGESPYVSRSNLIKRLATGVEPDVSEFQQAIFDEGHEFEALARPLAEKIVGDDLYQIVGRVGRRSASYDGLDMAWRIGFEHKRINNAIREAFAAAEAAGREMTGADLPLLYQIQMQQQCDVCDTIEKVLFMASDWTIDGRLLEEVHCWYYPNPELGARVDAGWELLHRDVAAYVPEVTPVKAVGRAPESLPAVFIELQGRVIATNVDEYKATAIAVFESINRDLKTDQDFADAEKTVAWCKDIEERLEAAKQHALSQTSSIETLFRDIDEIIASSKDTRLDLKKLVDRRKEEIKGEIVAEGVTGLADHIAELNAAIGRPYMPKVPADFGAAIKGKRNVDMMRDAVRTLLANTKIEASRIGTQIQTNMGTLRELSGEKYAFLFPDTHTIVLKPADDLTTLVKLRISEHEAKEAKRLEDERARIRAEEASRVEREAEEKRQADERARLDAEAKQRDHNRRMAQSEIMGIRQQVAIATSGRLGVRQGGTIDCIRETLAETKAWVIGDHLGEFKDAAQSAKDESIIAIQALLDRAEAPPPAPAPAPMAQVAPAEPPAPAPSDADEVPTLKLGDINARLGLLSVSADNLAGLGFPGVKKGAARLYCESDWLAILHALGAHLRTLRDQARQAAAEAVAEAA